MRTNLSILLICLLVSFGAFAQHNTSELPTSISETGTAPDNSAILDLQSSNKGLLAPRMTYAEIRAIPSPAEGLLAYDTENHCLRIFNGSKWDCLYQKTGGFTGEQDISMHGGAGSQYGEDITTDASGNIYIIGFYYGTTVFENTTLPHIGDDDVFIVKYDSSGTLIWAKNIGGTSEDKGYSIAVSQNGDVYVTGYFLGSATCDGTQVNSRGYEDIFVAKYDTSGTLQWVQTAGGDNYDMGYAIDVDSNGDAYVTGYFYNTLTFDDGSTLVSNGNKDIFIAKYSSAGTLLWAKGIGSIYADVGDGLVLDDSGNFYITGGCQGNVSFDAININGAGSYDAFVAKYDTNGNAQWVKIAQGGTSDAGKEITLDNAGNIHIVGSFTGQISFENTQLQSIGGSDVFTAKYDDQGNLLWAKHIGGGGSNDEGFGIDTDTNGNIYITGYFNGLSIFGDGTALEGSITHDVFITKYDNAGNFEWIQSAGHSTSSDMGKAVTSSPNGDVYIIGYLKGIALFEETPLVGGGGYDVFIAKYSQ